MSTENEGEHRPREESGTEPTAGFDAFRARRADEREQQETQTSYTFPAEYAADPDALFPPDPPAGAPPYGPQAPSTGTATARRWRSAAIFGGAVLVAVVIGLAAWAAFGASGPSSATASGGTPAGTATGAATSASTAGAAGDATGKRGRLELTFRVTITSVGADSFTGTVLANGDDVTIALIDTTRYGTKIRPFSQAQLAVGETVLVHGKRTGLDTVTASVVAADAGGSTGAAAGDAA
jgi:hypothetical protein